MPWRAWMEGRGGFREIVIDIRIDIPQHASNSNRSLINADSLPIGDIRVTMRGELATFAVYDLLKRVENSLWKLENKNDVRLEIISFFSAYIFDSIKLRRKYFIYIRSLVSISVKFDKIDIFIISYIHLFREYLVSFFKSWFETEEIIHILIQCKISFLIRVCLYCTYVYFYEILLI